MNSKVEYELKTPVKLASGETLSKVSLEEIDIGTMIEIEDADASDGIQGLMALAAMTGLDLADFKKIKTSDAMQIKKCAEDAWGNVRVDGENSPS